MTAGGRNWFEVYMMTLTAAFAVSAWATASAQQSIAATFPAWSQHIWVRGSRGDQTGVTAPPESTA